jgi:RNA recognition motif-containing protein
MQVKFKDEKSAREAMERLDGMEINGVKLQVTQVFQLIGSFKLKFGRNFNQTRLQQIKESEDSDDADPESSNDNESYPHTIEEDENDNHEQIEK